MHWLTCPKGEVEAVSCIVSSTCHGWMQVSYGLGQGILFFASFFIVIMQKQLIASSHSKGSWRTKSVLCIYFIADAIIDPH